MLGQAWIYFSFLIEDLVEEIRSASIMFMHAAKLGNMTGVHQREIIKIIKIDSKKKNKKEKRIEVCLIGGYAVGAIKLESQQ